MAHILFTSTFIAWSMRLYLHWQSTTFDLFILLATTLWHFQADVITWLKIARFPWIWLVLVNILLGIIVVVWKTWQNSISVQEIKSEAGPGLLQPMFFPCRTSHTRKFPKRHSFSYSYLFVGIPVGYRGSVGSLLAVDPYSTDQLSTWFSVAAKDYLHRGSTNVGLKEKLRSYLRSQGLEPDCYPYAYLVTAPRFLGYQFNPVSFWYLYSASKDLVAMILEVNNTFDERRMYLLAAEPEDYANCSAQNGCPPSLSDTLSLPDLPISGKPGLSYGLPTAFTQSWPKDFHVSPFNSRKGSYSLTAHDPVSLYAKKKPPINNTILLKSSKGHAKLVARVFSTSAPVDPAKSSPLEVLIFVARWWWVGLVTFPRIVKEAGLLFFRERLRVWFRPEVLKGTIGRRESTYERVVEGFFREYIRDQVERVSVPLAFRYIAAGSCSVREETFNSPSVGQNSGFAKHLTLDILSPAFYTRFMHYSEWAEAIIQEASSLGKDKTVSGKDLKELTTVWEEQQGSDASSRDKFLLSSTMDYLDYLQWWVFCCFRYVSRLKVLFSVKASKEKRTLRDIFALPLTSFDRFIIASYATPEIRVYRQTAMKLFLSELIAFSNPTILHIYDLVLRFMLTAVSWGVYEAPFTSLACPEHGDLCSRMPVLYDGLWAFLLLNITNIWTLLKSGV